MVQDTHHPNSESNGELTISRTTQERNQLTEDNIALARRIVHRMWRAGTIRGIDTLDDALQEGYCALVEAIDKQDFGRENASWSNYIYKSVCRRLIKRSLENGNIRTPITSLQDDTSAAIKEKATRAKRFSGELEDIGVECNVTLRMEVQEMMATFGRYLTKEEQKLLRMRFGFDGKPMSFREYARILDVSHEEVRLRYKEALRKLRERMGIVQEERQRRIPVACS